MGTSGAAEDYGHYKPRHHLCSRDVASQGTVLGQAGASGNAGTCTLGKLIKIMCDPVWVLGNMVFDNRIQIIVFSLPLRQG